jgi:hypothetical protein
VATEGHRELLIRQLGRFWRRVGGETRQRVGDLVAAPRDVTQNQRELGQQGEVAGQARGGRARSEDQIRVINQAGDVRGDQTAELGHGPGDGKQLALTHGVVALGGGKETRSEAEHLGRGRQVGKVDRGGVATAGQLIKAGAEGEVARIGAQHQLLAGVGVTQLDSPQEGVLDLDEGGLLLGAPSPGHATADKGPQQREVVLDTREEGRPVGRETQEAGQLGLGGGGAEGGEGLQPLGVGLDGGGRDEVAKIV